MKDTRRDARSERLHVIITGALLALGLQTVATLVLLAIQHSGREVAAATIGSDVVSASFGFAVVARKVSRRQAILIGVVFFPTILGLMFLEAIYLDGKIFGNTF